MSVNLGIIGFGGTGKRHVNNAPRTDVKMLPVMLELYGIALSTL